MQDVVVTPDWRLTFEAGVGDDSWVSLEWWDAAGVKHEVGLPRPLAEAAMRGHNTWPKLYARLEAVAASTHTADCHPEDGPTFRECSTAWCRENARVLDEARGEGGR